MAGEDWTLSDPWWNSKVPTKTWFFPDGTMKRDPLPPSVPPDGFKWKFVAESCGRKRPVGSFVRINHYPTYHVSRFKNWGFIMQSCWVLFTSFPMPPKGKNPDLEDENLDITFENQQIEAFAYNAGLGQLFDGDALGFVVQLLQAARAREDVNDQENSDDDASDSDVTLE